MISNLLTKIGYTTIAIIVTNIVNAQTEQVSSQQFSDSIQAKASESHLTKMRDRDYAINKRTTFWDSANNQIAQLYPKGETAAIIRMQQDHKKVMDKTYTLEEFKSIKKDFPKVSFNNKNTPSTQYYEKLTSEAFPIFIEKDSSAALAYAEQLNPTSVREMAEKIAKDKQNLPLAEKMAKIAMLNTKKWYDKRDSDDGVLSMFYPFTENTYATILEQQGRKEEALSYLQDAFTISKGKMSAVNESYLTLLNANGNTKAVLDAAKKIYTTGRSNDKIKSQVETAFNKENPNQSFDAFLTELSKEKTKVENNAFAASLMNKPSHDFKLKNLNGEEVSLSSLKGKVVVLDFWATWCGPCKMSFPGMQLAVNKYKDNKDVVFLFVDTYEKEDPKETKQQVSDFIKKQKYTFDVVFDEKSQVVTAYGINGIPNKVFIGKDGNIKFQTAGYPGSDKAVLDEVSKSVDLLLKN